MKILTKNSNFLFQNVKFQRKSADQVTVRQEGSIVAGQKDNCADVAARSQLGDYPSVDSVHASIAKGMVNVLAIAAATEITFEATVGKSTTNTVCLLDINRR